MAYTSIGGSPTIDFLVYAPLEVHLNLRSILSHWFLLDSQNHNTGGLKKTPRIFQFNDFNNQNKLNQ